MKSFIYLYGLFFLSFLSCKKQTDTPVSNVKVTFVEIKLDTEDHLYKLNDVWYRWGEEYNSCSPDFHAEYIIYSLEEAELIIRYCNDVISLSVESITVSSSECENSAYEVQQYVEDEMFITKINVSAEFNRCMLDNNGTIYLNFDFSE